MADVNDNDRINRLKFRGGCSLATTLLLLSFNYTDEIITLVCLATSLDVFGDNVSHLLQVKFQQFIFSVYIPFSNN